MVAHRLLVLVLLVLLAPPQRLDVFGQGKHSVASPAFDCLVRQELLYDRAMQILPPSRLAERQAVFDALQLASACNATRPDRASPSVAVAEESDASDAVAVIRVSTTGSDSNGNGSAARPFASLARAQVAARAVHRSAHERVIVQLAAGRYFLNQTLVLGPPDSGTIWRPEPGVAGKVILSGGMPLNGLNWTAAAGGSGNIMRASLPHGFPSFSSLFVHGERAVRARAPNGNMETSLCLNPQFMSSGRVGPQYCPSHFAPPAINGISQADPDFAFLPMLYREGCKDVPPHADATQYPECFGTIIEVAEPNRGVINPPRTPTKYTEGTSWQGGMNPRYTKFVGGVTKRWDPPEAVASIRSLYGGCMSGGIVPPMNCMSTDPSAAPGSAAANVSNLCPCTVPGGIKLLRNVTFGNTLGAKPWADASTGIVHAFHPGFWGNNQLTIARRTDGPGNRTTLEYAGGGWQMAQSAASHREYFIENIKELLDMPGEFFLEGAVPSSTNGDNQEDDEVNGESIGRPILYYIPNRTAVVTGKSSRLELLAATEIIAPVLDALIMVEGTQSDPVRDVTLSNFTFAHSAETYLKSYEVPSGGDYAIHRNGAVRLQGTERSTVSSCHFDRLGGNGLVLSDYNRNTTVIGNHFRKLGDSAMVLVGSAELLDATGGNQPRLTKIEGNTAYEYGLIGKQVAAVFQAVSCQTLIKDNIFFSGPRHGVNFNDGMGGGNRLIGNLLFNQVRESSDAGPFNSWDRTTFLSDVRNGSAEPSVWKAWDEISYNLIYNNYQSTWPIDHDDGSSFFHDHSNVLIYGGYKNLFGHDQLIEKNLYIYPDHTSPFDGRHPDGTDSWRDFVATQWSGPNQPSPAAASKMKARQSHDTAPVGLGSYDAPYCALSAEACLYNATTKTQTMCDGSGYNLRYENNSCVFSGAGTAGAALPVGQTWPAAFWYSACQLSNLSNPATMITRNNRYFTDLVNDSHHLEVTCGDDSVPLSTWQRRYNQDLGSTLAPAPTAREIVAMAWAKLLKSESSRVPVGM